MKQVKLLMLAAALLLAPMTASAGLVGEIIGRLDLSGDFIADDFDDDFTRPVPEPSGALVMGVALATVALAKRRQRN